eukprot:CAMPEP_0113577696 /NCGR_PEP_ID=MMETSP0015_2-20120614/29028_1 /TAXON_ID=2838 /ORGANISM="Odontella" /LENGTH=280 /DNA_ID=CAMNT_0000481337 /DNA_START=1 /DNA_END=844 /DNA_ORIENTATION=+ /assembly_acc=CAM_ASM_000160
MAAPLLLVPIIFAVAIVLSGKFILPELRSALSRVSLAHVRVDTIEADSAETSNGASDDEEAVASGRDTSCSSPPAGESNNASSLTQNGRSSSSAAARQPPVVCVDRCVHEPLPPVRVVTFSPGGRSIREIFFRVNRSDSGEHCNGGERGDTRMINFDEDAGGGRAIADNVGETSKCNSWGFHIGVALVVFIVVVGVIAGAFVLISQSNRTKGDEKGSEEMPTHTAELDEARTQGEVKSTNIFGLAKYDRATDAASRATPLFSQHGANIKMTFNGQNGGGR